ncbi:MAG: hypothetical protein CR992_00910 [Desulfobacterales bacterium]|nr:MAG: hypothetical protein CR992_00910 [Desulfobacterales bacterium]
MQDKETERIGNYQAPLIKPDWHKWPSEKRAVKTSQTGGTFITFQALFQEDFSLHIWPKAQQS